MITPNTPCPCGSKQKYKRCCQKYHKGALAKDALTLMKSRYTAYAVGDANYIIKTTHPKNPDYHDNKKQWKEEIKNFCKSTQFLKLEILEFIDGEDEAFVSFKATFENSIMTEKSRFLKVDGRWLYI